MDVTDNVEDGRMSNVIEVVLPLETSQIKLPSEDERQDQEELYQEYIVIQEGSGYLTAMDGRNFLFDMSHHQMALIFFSHSGFVCSYKFYSFGSCDINLCGGDGINNALVVTIRYYNIYNFCKFLTKVKLFIKLIYSVGFFKQKN